MSNFTTQVRWICDYGTEPPADGKNNVSESIARGVSRVFTFDFPIFDEEYRNTLETKIIRHFYTREIGYETVALWKLKLEDKLNLIMPYYNQLYESCLIEFDPLVDVNYSRTGNKNDVKNNTEREDNIENTSGTETVNSTETRNENRTENRTNSENMSREEINNELRNNTKENNGSESVSDSENNIRTGNQRQEENNNRQYDGTDTGTNSEVNRETASGNKNSNGVKANTLQDNRWDLYSDTPQSGIQGIDPFNYGSQGSVDQNAYLTNARRNTDDKTENDVTNNTEYSSQVGMEDRTGNTHVIYDYDTTEQNSKTNINNETEAINKSSSKSKTNQETNVDTLSGRNSRNDEKSGNSSVEENNNRDKFDNKFGSTNKSKNQNRNLTGSTIGNQDYFEKIVGKRGSYSYSKMLDEFRKTFLNIDLMIINELEPLFMGLWE